MTQIFDTPTPTRVLAATVYRARFSDLAHRLQQAWRRAKLPEHARFTIFLLPTLENEPFNQILALMAAALRLKGDVDPHLAEAIFAANMSVDLYLDLVLGHRSLYLPTLLVDITSCLEAAERLAGEL